MRISRRLLNTFGFAAAGLLAAAGAAHAQLLTSDVGVNPTYEQTGPTTVVSTGGFFSARAFFTSTGDYSGGTVTIPTSVVETLVSSTSPPALTYGDSNTDFSTLEGDYPAGDYTFDLTGGTYGPTEYTIDYAGDAYSNVPELTATSYDGLQGLDAADPYTVTFNAMVVSANATPGANAIYFSIVNSSDVTVFSDTLPTTATSVTIPGGTLLPGQTYSFDLLFDDRIVTDDGNVLLTQFYDTHTDGAFTTAIPEPSTWVMMLLGFAGLGFAGLCSARKLGGTIAA